MATNSEVSLPLSVFSLSGLSGVLSLVAGANITITPSGSSITISATGGGGGSVTSVGLADSTGLFTVSGSPVTSTGTLTLASLNVQSANKVFAGPTTGAAASPTFRSLVATDLNTLVVPAANGGCPPVTKYLYVDKNRTDSFTADGSFARPFATISAAIAQIVTNGDNGTFPYYIDIIPGAYAETLTFNSSTFHNVTLSASITASTALQNLSITGITCTANNTQFATLIFNGFTLSGATNLVGDINGTNFASTQCLFSSCQFNGGHITLNNLNNVNFYNCQVQGSTASTFTNVAFGYMNGAEGFIGGTTLHLVDNPGGNVPSQYSGNYLLFNQTKFYGTVTIDAGSELDTLTAYFGSTSVVTNNGTIHSWATNWSGTAAVVLNSGSLLRTRGDFFYLPPTVNSGATLTPQGQFLDRNTGFTTTAAAAGTTVLTSLSTNKQFFTGSTTQTVTLPVATTLQNGFTFFIANSSSGTVTVQTSGSNTIKAMAANSTLLLVCVNTAGGTGTASWNWQYTAALNN